jgi:hypothetical protein
VLQPILVCNTSYGNWVSGEEYPLLGWNEDQASGFAVTLGTSNITVDMCSGFSGDAIYTIDPQGSYVWVDESKVDIKFSLIA